MGKDLRLKQGGQAFSLTETNCLTIRSKFLGLRLEKDEKLLSFYRAIKQQRRLLGAMPERSLEFERSSL